MDCKSCEVPQTNNYVVILGQVLCLACYKLEFYLEEESECFQCKAVQKRRHLYYCSDLNFRCRACRPQDRSGECKDCQRNLLGEEFVYFDEKFCKICYMDKSFECSFCGIGTSFRQIVVDSRKSMVCIGCPLQNLDSSGKHCTDCRVELKGYLLYSKRTLCFDCWDGSPARFKLKNSLVLISSQITTEERTLCKLLNKLDDELWTYGKFLSDHSKAPEQKVAKRKAITKLVAEVRSEFSEVNQEHSIAQGFDFYRGTMLAVQALLNSLENQEFLRAEIDGYYLVWDYFLKKKLLRVWLVLKDTNDVPIQVFFCDRLLYYFSFFSEMTSMFVGVINKALEGFQVTQLIPQSIKDVLYSVMSTEFVKQKYLEELNLSQDYLQVLQSTLEKTYLCSRGLEDCGVSLMDGSILIKDYRHSPKKHSGSPSKKPKLDEFSNEAISTGCVLICFIHEFAHILARADLSRGLEFVQLINSPEKYAMNTQKTENGFYMEKKLLNENESQRQVLVQDAAELIVNPQNWCEGIQEKFQLLNRNQANKPSITLKRFKKCSLHE